MVRDRADSLFVAPDAFFASRRVQFATLAACDRVPTSRANREMVEAGKPPNRDRQEESEPVLLLT
jgi:hypothetical protein